MKEVFILILQTADDALVFLRSALDLPQIMVILLVLAVILARAWR